MSFFRGEPFMRWWRHQMETFSTLLAFCTGIHRSPVYSPHKGQWRGALMFSMIYAWTNSWANNKDACCLRLHRAHYNVTVMKYSYQANMWYTIYVLWIWIKFDINCMWMNWTICVIPLYPCLSCFIGTRYCVILNTRMRDQRQVFTTQKCDTMLCYHKVLLL